MISKAVAIFLLLYFGLGLAAQPDCSLCHSEIVQSYRRSGMGRSVGAPAPSKARFVHGSSVLRVDGVRHAVDRDELTAAYPAALRIGSGKVGSSFAVRIGDRWFQSPISWFEQSKQFRVSPGFEGDRHLDFDRPIRPECLRCHASGSVAEPQPIGCERCHGDASAHAAKPSFTNIINPSKLARVPRDSVCEQCHLQGAARVLLEKKAPENFRPADPLESTWLTYIAPGDFKVASHAELFAQSPCARSGKLWCASCHNPHPTAAKPQRTTDSVCLDCHQQHERGESQCASCHMPKRAVADVVHTAYTDHRIQRPGSTLTLQGLQPWRGDSPRERGLAMFEVGEARGEVEMLQQAYRILVSQPARDAAVLAALGTLTLQKSRPVEAAQLFEQAVRQEPGNAEAWFRLGLAQQAAGKTDAAVDAFQAASKADPYFFQAYVAEATLRKSDKSEYRRILERYLRHVPQSLAARKALAAAR